MSQSKSKSDTQTEDGVVVGPPETAGPFGSSDDVQPTASSKKKKNGKKKRFGKYRSWGKQSSASGDRSVWVDKNPPLSRKDRKVLTSYLQAYKDGAFRIFDAAIGTKSLAAMKEEDQLFTSSPIVISGLQFPPLNDDLLSGPYLALPTMKSAKQRSHTHGICIDLDLYHDSFGSDRNNRQIIVSIYHDGLSHCPDLSPIPNPVSIRNYHPWVRQREAGCPIGSVSPSVERKTREAKEAIQALIDQPGQCLRDDIDFLDFEKMKDDDLSRTHPPQMAGNGDEWLLVDTPEKMMQCIRELEGSKPTEIAFDLEAYNKSNFLQQTCLLQLTANRGREYVVDTLAPGVWECVNGLAPLFADPKVVKIGHAISGLDARCLHRDFGIFIVNVFDTYEAAKQLEDVPHGLAKLCGHYGMPDSTAYQLLKDSYQNTNWRHRPLTEAMIEYSRFDIHYLIPLRKLLMRDLAKQDLFDQPNGYSKDTEARQVASSLADILRRCDEDDEVEGFNAMYGNRLGNTASDSGSFHTTEEQSKQNNVDDDDDDEEDFQDCVDEPQSFFDASELRMNSALMHVLSISQDRCMDIWSLNKTEKHLSNDTFLSYIERSKHGEITFRQSQLRLYDQLARWRDHVAWLEECLPGFCCTLDFLAQVCHRRPTDHNSLRRITYFLPSFLGDVSKDGDGTTTYEDELLALVRASRNTRDHEDDDDDNDDLDVAGAAPSYTEDYLARIMAIRRRRKWVWLAVSAGIVAVAATVVSISSSRRRRR